MLKFDHVSFSYENKPILNDFSLSVEKGEIVAIMGASGIGKSTILNLAAGILKPQSGTVPSEAKKISYAFQEPRLFPWLNTIDNVNAVLSAKKESLEDTKRALEFVELSGNETLSPSELSGGMKSRVSLARAIAYNGDLYLLDEPFAALDESLKERLTKKLHQHIKERGATALFVTHQASDAKLLADRIITI